MSSKTPPAAAPEVLDPSGVDGQDPFARIAQSTQGLVDRISSNFLAVAERTIAQVNGVVEGLQDAAAQKIDLATRVLKVNAQVDAFASVLETIASQKKVLTARLGKAEGPAKRLLELQMDLLTQQETSVLDQSMKALTVKEAV